MPAEPSSHAATDIPIKPEQPSPKVFWTACDSAGVAAKGICDAIEKVTHSANEILSLVCKWGLVFSCVGLGFGYRVGNHADFRITALLYCAGLLAANFGEQSFGERGFTSAISLPFLLGLGLYIIPT